MTGPIDFGGGGLPAMGALGGAFSGVSKALDTLLQLKLAEHQMKFQRDQQQRQILGQHGVIPDTNFDPSSILNAPPAPQHQEMQPLALSSPTADIAPPKTVIDGTPNLQQAQGQFQLDISKPGYGQGMPIQGGYAMPTSAQASPEAAYGRALLDSKTKIGIAAQPYDRGPTPEQEKQNELRQHQIDLQNEIAKLRLEMLQGNSDRSFGLRSGQFDDRRYNKIIDDYKNDMKSPNTAMAAYQRVLGELNSGSSLNAKTATGALSQLAVPENAREASQINATLNQMTGKIFGGPFTSWENFQTMIDKIITLHGSTLPEDAKAEIQKAADALIVFQRTKRKMAQERAMMHAKRKNVDMTPGDLEGQTEYELWENQQQPQAPQGQAAPAQAAAAPGTVNLQAQPQQSGGKHDRFLVTQ